LTTAGKRKFQQLWKAGESIRTAMHSTLQSADAALLVKLLTNIAESLNGDLVAATASSQSLTREES
jgi:hypothetical protein